MVAAGIEAMNVFGGSACVDVMTLAEHRGLDPARVANLLMRQKAVALPYEDAITYGVNAARALLDTLSEAEKDRIELLKEKILHFTKDLLEFETVEIRLLKKETGELKPLMSVGMRPEAERRVLFAIAEHNGVTGFVAATGRSYLCEDTTRDRLYLPGAYGAKSSLTVPLVLHEEILGTFNVESPEPRAFTESDLQFLEIFCRDLAAALNTLELLVAQKANAALESCEAIHRAVALPVDEILNDAVNVMERYIGHEPALVERLQRILRNARDIKKTIQSVGRKEMIAAMEFVRRFCDQNLTLTDGAGLYVMEKLRITSCWSFQTTCSMFSAKVRPVTVRQSPCR